MCVEIRYTGLEKLAAIGLKSTRGFRWNESESWQTSPLIKLLKYRCASSAASQSSTVQQRRVQHYLSPLVHSLDQFRPRDGRRWIKKQASTQIVSYLVRLQIWHSLREKVRAQCFSGIIRQFTLAESKQRESTERRILKAFNAHNRTNYPFRSHFFSILHTLSSSSFAPLYINFLTFSVRRGGPRESWRRIKRVVRSFAYEIILFFSFFATLPTTLDQSHPPHVHFSRFAFSLSLFSSSLDSPQLSLKKKSVEVRLGLVRMERRRFHSFFYAKHTTHSLQACLPPSTASSNAFAAWIV